MVCASVGEACGLRVEGAQAPTKQRRRTCEWDGSGGRFSLASGGAGARARAQSRGSPWTLVGLGGKARPYELRRACSCNAPVWHTPCSWVSSSSVQRPPIPRWCPVRAWLFFTFLPTYLPGGSVTSHCLGRDKEAPRTHEPTHTERDECTHCIRDLTPLCAKPILIIGNRRLSIWFCFLSISEAL